jgi:hypothetical protein
MQDALRSPNLRRRSSRLKRAIAWTAAAAVIVSATAAVAASLTLGSTSVGAGNAVVPRCDANGFTYAFTTSHGNVTSVTVGDIADPACEGGVMHVTLTDTGGSILASAGPQTVPTDGDGLPNSVSLSTSAQPPAGQVAGIHAAVNGP